MNDVFFSNFFAKETVGNTNEQTHYHISNVFVPDKGWVLDTKWWGGLNFHSEAGDVVLKSQYATVYIGKSGRTGINTLSPAATLDVSGTFRANNSGNQLLYNGGDIILKVASRTSNTTSAYRAIVHDVGDILTLNYTGDYPGGTKIASNTIIKNDGSAAFKGKVEAKEVKVTTTPTADFVFEESYELPKLDEVEKFIKENRHLPEIASAEEMEQEGVNIGEFQIKLLQKIEELTLYTIQQSKWVEVLKQENEGLRNRLERIELLEKKTEKIASQTNKTE